MRTASAARVLSARTVIRAAWLASGLALAILVVGTLARLLTLGEWPRTWDDLFMFVRYADNLRATGVLAWNPGATPTYGLTAPLYVAVVLPVRLFVSSPVLAAMLSSALCGLAALGVLVVVLHRCLATANAVARALAIALVCGALAAAAQVLLAHFLSGMDTAFVLLYLALYFLLITEHARRGTRLSLILAGVWGGLAYFVRPDVLVFTAVVPLARLILGPDRRARREALGLLAVSGLVVGAQLVIARLYFGTWLPLPFYVKSAANIYGPYFASLYEGRAWTELQGFGGTYWPLLGMLLAGILAGPRRWWRRTAPEDKGLLVATLLFVGYYLWFVLQIMYYDARFYQPALPALVILAGQGACLAFERWGPTLTRWTGRVPVGLQAAAAIVLVGWVGLSLGGGLLDLRAALAEFDPTIYDPAEVVQRTGYHNYWYDLVAFSALPDDMVMATTEVGFPAALNPTRQIVDMAGLNEPGIALGGFDAGWFFDHYRPDLIYMPNPDYNEIINSLERSPVFTADYDLFPAQDLEAVMAVALRRDSPYYDQMRDIIDRRDSGS